MRGISLLGFGVAIVCGCGDDDPKPAVDAPLPNDDMALVDMTLPDAPPGMPATLAETGLCADAACTTINPGIIEYTPAFELWSDGATKRRWVQFPAGTQIDTTNMDFWKFPVGTKVWKEFTRDGVRCETRYITKLADENDPPPAISWFYISYQWNLAQDATTAVSQGAQDVNGTGHDIPSRALCRSCHDRVKGPDRDRGRLLGIGALQLDHDAIGNQLSLAKLVADGTLSNPPPAPTAGQPYFPMTFTTQERPAMGYLHANCGHCHNSSSEVIDTVAVDLRLAVGTLTSATAPSILTTVDVDAERSFPPLPLDAPIVKPMDPAGSVMIGRMLSTDFQYHMPQAGSEIVDPTGQTVLGTWINSITP